MKTDHLDKTNASLVFSFISSKHVHMCTDKTHLEWKLNLLNAAHHLIASGCPFTLSASSIVNYHCCSIDQSMN